MSYKDKNETNKYLSRYCPNKSLFQYDLDVLFYYTEKKT